MKESKLTIINTIAIAMIIGSLVYFHSGIHVKAPVVDEAVTEAAKEADEKELFESILKPCPLCGHEVKLVPIDEDWFIECERYNFEDHDDHGCGLKTGYYKNKDELINMWNAMEGRGYTTHEQLQNKNTLTCSREGVGEDDAE